MDKQTLHIELRKKSYALGYRLRLKNGNEFSIFKEKSRTPLFSFRTKFDKDSPVCQCTIYYEFQTSSPDAEMESLVLWYIEKLCQMKKIDVISLPAGEECLRYESLGYKLDSIFKIKNQPSYCKYLNAEFEHITSSLKQIFSIQKASDPTFTFHMNLDFKSMLRIFLYKKGTEKTFHIKKEENQLILLDVDTKKQTPASSFAWDSFFTEMEKKARLSNLYNPPTFHFKFWANKNKVLIKPFVYESLVNHFGAEELEVLCAKENKDEMGFSKKIIRSPYTGNELFTVAHSFDCMFILSTEHQYFFTPEQQSEGFSKIMALVNEHMVKNGKESLFKI